MISSRANRAARAAQTIEPTFYQTATAPSRKFRGVWAAPRPAWAVVSALCFDPHDSLLAGIKQPSNLRKRERRALDPPAPNEKGLQPCFLRPKSGYLLILVEALPDLIPLHTAPARHRSGRGSLPGDSALGADCQPGEEHCRCHECRNQACTHRGIPPFLPSELGRLTDPPWANCPLRKENQRRRCKGHQVEYDDPFKRSGGELQLEVTKALDP